MSPLRVEIEYHDRRQCKRIIQDLVSTALMQVAEEESEEEKDSEDVRTVPGSNCSTALVRFASLARREAFYSLRRAIC